MKSRQKVGVLMVQNILLIGMMGVGKTAVGRNLARDIEWDFFDTDTAMEEVTGLKLKDIYTKYGEIRFRSEESLILRRLPLMRQTVISTGGSLPFTAEAEKIIKESGYVIWLQAETETVQKRLKKKNGKLFLPKGTAEIDLAELVSARNRQFEALADLVVPVEDHDLDAVV
jgi:shikimate kinase